MDLTEILHPEIEKFYHEDPGNISLDFYWFYKGQFEIFKKEYHDNQQVTITLPKNLNDYTMENRKTGANTGFASGGVTCKLGALCFYSSLYRPEKVYSVLN